MLKRVCGGWGKWDLAMILFRWTKGVKNQAIQKRLAESMAKKTLVLEIRIIIATLLGFALLSALLIADLQAERDKIIVTTTENVFQKSQIISQSFGDTFLAADYVLRDILDRITIEDLVYPDPDEKHLKRMTRLLEVKTATVPNAIDGSLYDGKCIFTAGIAVQPGYKSTHLFCNDRSLSKNGEDTYVRYIPASFSAINKAVISISRNRWTSSGELQGGVQIIIDIGQIQSWLHSLKTGPDDVVAIVDEVGVVLASTSTGFRPGNNNIDAVKFKGVRTSTRVLSQEGNLLLDAEHRIYGLSRAERLPFTVIVGVDKKNVLAEWRRHVWQLGGSFVALMIVALIAMKVYLTMLRQRGELRESTLSLESSHQKMAAAHKQIDDSIDYAKFIQQGILPQKQLVDALDDECFVLWRPKNTVGGDFYFFHGDRDCMLIGVVDCAGHGVPGAMMTMLTRAALDHVIREIGIADPAAVLKMLDSTLRSMLEASELPGTIVTTVDAGLIYVNRSEKRLMFAGAKMGLYWSDGERTRRVSSDRRSVNGKHRGTYRNTELELFPNLVFYLFSDGYLDQSGGIHGFGLSEQRLSQVVLKAFQLPMEQQREVFDALLREHQGNEEQRDDITVLGFRI